MKECVVHRELNVIFLFSCILDKKQWQFYCDVNGCWKGKDSMKLYLMLSKHLWRWQNGLVKGEKPNHLG